MKKIKIAVLYGGFSAERSISLKTGKAVFENLKVWKDFEVTLVDIKKNKYLEQIINLKKQKIDIAFIALHGKFGEDGKLQALLESVGIKYTGADVVPSLIGMNKHLTKSLLQVNKIPTPPWRIVNSLDEVEHVTLSFPVVVKPVDEGSTIGVSIVHSRENLKIAIRNAFKYSDKVIIEKFIKGKEITVPVLGGEVLPMIEIVPKCNTYYDFKSKYKPGGSEHLIPPKIDTHAQTKITEVVKKTVSVIGCEILCRVDIILDEKNKTPYVLEVNTIPGMTPTSLLPESAKYLGISFPELVRKIVFLSLEKYE